MLINLRNALMAGKRLPYDAEVEYLESSGTQWIETPYTVNTATDKIRVAFQGLETVKYKWFFGIYDNSGAIRMASGSGDMANRRTVAYGSNTNYVADSITYNGPHELVADSNGLSIDGTSQFSFALFASTSKFCLFTFGRNGSPASESAGAVRVFAFQHWRNGMLISDYIPVRKGTVGYLYDRVSGKLFGNAGAGDFVLVQDVVPVEYIESHGTEYIAMGIAGSALSRVDIGIEKTETNGTRRFVVGSNRDPNASIGSSTYFDVNTSGYFGQNSNGFACTVGQWYNLSIRADGYYSDGVKVYSPSYVFPLRPSVELCLLSLGTATGGRWVGRVSYLKAWDTNGNLAQDLLPVRVGTEGAMMDVLTRRIYRNAGTGAFTYGNDLKYPIPAE